MIHLLLIALLAQPCPNRSAVLEAGAPAPCSGVLVSPLMLDRAVEAKASSQACLIRLDASREACAVRVSMAQSSLHLMRAALTRATLRVVKAPAPRTSYTAAVIAGVVGLALGAAGVVAIQVMTY